MTTDTRIIGHYELIEKIAEGGMGAVYKAKSLKNEQIVAIKIIPAETAKNPLLIKRFEQEFRAASLIDHPHVVKAIDYCGHGATPFLVMEFVDGQSLGARIDRDGAIPEEEAIRIIHEVCLGLHRAHKQGLIHRDVKPDNILLTREGTAKLTDLGLVKDVEGEMNLTKTGRGLGTPHFMAPEQFRNAKNADVRCDVYSLGATLYTMVTGEIPFDKTTPLDCWLKKTKNDFPQPIQLRPGLSKRMNWAILRAMHFDPAERPANCREFMEDVLGRGWQTTQQPSSAHGMSRPELSPAQHSSLNPSEPDLTNTEPPPPPPDDIWYMVYKDAQGQTHTVKGTTKSIRKNLMVGILGQIQDIIVCRTKTGQFQPLSAIPEFRDLALQSGSSAKRKPAMGKNAGSAASAATPSDLSPASHRGMPGLPGVGLPPLGSPGVSPGGGGLLGETPRVSQSPTRPLDPGSSRPTGARSAAVPVDATVQQEIIPLVPLPADRSTASSRSTPGSGRPSGILMPPSRRMERRPTSDPANENDTPPSSQATWILALSLGVLFLGLVLMVVLFFWKN